MRLLAAWRLGIDMAKFNVGFSGINRFGSWVSRLAVVAVAGLMLSDAASAQAFRSDVLGWKGQTEIKIEASKPETVRLLAGILEIRSNLQLALLAKQEGVPSAHVSDLHSVVWPEYKDGLMAAGAVDLDPLFQKLDEASKKEDVAAAHAEIEGVLMKARAALQPTSADSLLAVQTVAKDVATGFINQSGPTDANNYQDAWAMIMAARGELDLLMRDPDPAIAKYASESAMAFDDLIISLPDPNQSTPVQLDPAPFNDLVGKLEKIDQEA